MASTPDTSFESDDFKPRGRATQRKGSPTLELPSPRSSEARDDDLHELAVEAARCTNAIEAAYQTLWASFCGLPWSGQSNPTFRLDQEAYERLYDRLAQHPGLLEYFEEDIRKDWSAGTLTLLFMSSPLHDFFKELVAEAINKELDRVAEAHPVLQPYRRNILSGGTASIQKRKRRSQSRAPTFDKSPDGQWHYVGAAYPPFILEVAYSQDEENLNDKVAQFYEHLPGEICTVLGFDIAYAKRSIRKRPGYSHAASLSLWTSEGNGDTLEVDCTVDGQRLYQDGHGHGQLPGELLLPFKVFLPFRERVNMPPAGDENVVLTHAQLCELLGRAEERQRVIDERDSLSPPPQPFKKIQFKKRGLVTRAVELDKRRRTEAGSGASSAGPRRTRSASQPRRSSRLRSRD